MRRDWEDKHKVTEELVEGPPSRRANATLTPCPVGNHLWCIGGEFFSDDGKAYFYNDVFRYSPDKDEWRKFVSPTCPGPRSAHAVVASPAAGGKLFLFGGEFSSLHQTTFHHYRDFWCFDIQTHSWDRIETKVMPSARSGHRMAMWKHYIVLFGGFYDPGIRTNYLNDLWLSLRHLTIWLESKPALSYLSLASPTPLLLPSAVLIRFCPSSSLNLVIFRACHPSTRVPHQLPPYTPFGLTHRRRRLHPLSCFCFLLSFAVCYFTPQRTSRRPPFPHFSMTTSNTTPQSCIVFGNFALAGGRRVQSGATWYNHYHTAILTSTADSAMQAQLRVYSPRHDVPVADDTVAFVVARAYLPPTSSGAALLEALHCFPYPGDASAPDYDEHLPVIPAFVTALGVVRAVHPPSSLDHDKRISLEVGEWIRDERKTFNIDAKLDCASSRWTHFRLPAVQSIISVFGTCCALREDGSMLINLDNITLNAMPSSSNPAGELAGPRPLPDGTPVPPKKRKYTAFALPTSPDRKLSTIHAPADTSPTPGSNTRLLRQDLSIDGGEPISAPSPSTLLLSASNDDDGSSQADNERGPIESGSKAAGKRKART